MSKKNIILPDSLENLFVRLEEVVLSNSGENEFEEIFKLVVAKLWDEVNNLKLFNVYNNELETKENINKLLRESNKHWESVLTGNETNLTAHHLNVCVKTMINVELTAFGFEALDAFFEYIVSRTSKGSKGQFFTPRYVVDFCVRILSPKSNETILDPASGSGAFLLHSYEHMKNKDDKNILVPESINKNLWGFDFDEKAVRVARLLMYLAGLKKVNIHKVNSLLTPKSQQSLFELQSNNAISSIEDFIRINKATFKGFDVILTNPPFGGEITEPEFLKSFELTKNKIRIERDALFLERCINLLNPGGRMAIILPNNKVGGKEWSYLREWIMHKARVLGVIGLPQNTFKPHTSVKTSILFLEKRYKTKERKSEKIFFGISEKAGKDNRGNLDFIDIENQHWSNVNHDLDEIERQFTDFLLKEKIGGENSWLSVQ